MPEIGEVARVVHFIRKHLVNKTITKVTANVDEIVYGKVGTSAAEFEKNMKGKKIVDAGQQGKYFWMIMSSPPHPVMHFGMAGWFKIRGEHTYYYRKKENAPEEEWPPKGVKFLLEAKGDEGTTEAAFVDKRRLGRIRLVHCDGKEIRNNTPLKENGPDPVLDKDLVSLQWLTEKCGKKKVPIKAMLLDQGVISGIGNWVGDEIMYHAKMHPEQYANTLQDSQIKQLHKSIHFVCGLACELLADSDRFPEDWLFKHRWGKGKKTGKKTLPNGNRIEFLTVGGRTSAVVPAVQKKTGPTAGDLGKSDTDETEEDKEEEEEEEKPIRSSNKKRKAERDDDEEVKAAPKKIATKKAKTNGVEAEDLSDTKPPTRKTSTKKAKTHGVKTEDTADMPTVEAPKTSKRGKRGQEGKAVVDKTIAKKSEQSSTKRGKVVTAKENSKPEPKEEDTGRRRSSRLRK